MKMHRCGQLIAIGISVIFFIVKEASLLPSNIALGKITKQSSTYTYGSVEYYWKSNLANDGNRQQKPSSPVSFDLNCTHTDDPPQPQEWWAVNLGAIFAIFNISIYGRTDECCSDRFLDFDVDVISPESLSDSLTIDTIDSGKRTFSRYVPGVTTYIVIETDNTMGQFVRIRHRGTRLLTLCEVEVYGEVPCFSTSRVSYHRLFPGKLYQGIVIATTVAKSSVQCMLLCKDLPCCCAVNFNTVTEECILTNQVGPAIGLGLVSADNWNAIVLF